MGEWTKKLKDIASVKNSSWTDALPKAALLPVIAFFSSLASAIGAFFDIPINTADALAKGASGLIDSFLGGGGDIISAGARETATSLTTGVWAQFGPATFPIAIAVTIGGALVVARARQQAATSNLFPGVGGIDAPEWLPFVGEEEEEV